MPTPTQHMILLDQQRSKRAIKTLLTIFMISTLFLTTFLYFQDLITTPTLSAFVTGSY